MRTLKKEKKGRNLWCAAAVKKTTFFCGTLQCLKMTNVFNLENII